MIGHAKELLRGLASRAACCGRGAEAARDGAGRTNVGEYDEVIILAQPLTGDVARVDAEDKGRGREDGEDDSRAPEGRLARGSHGEGRYSGST